jgi:hypothetical protein
MFVKKVFQMVKAFLANLHSTISKKYSYIVLHDSKIFFYISFLTYEYKKNAEFYADFKPVEKVWKNQQQKSY